MTEQEQLARDVYNYNYGDLTVDQRNQLTEKFKTILQTVMSRETGINSAPSQMRPVYNQVKLALWSGYAKKMESAREARREIKRQERRLKENGGRH